MSKGYNSTFKIIYLNQLMKKRCAQDYKYQYKIPGDNQFNINQLTKIDFFLLQWHT